MGLLDALHSEDIETVMGLKVGFRTLGIEGLVFERLGLGITVTVHTA